VSVLDAILSVQTLLLLNLGGFVRPLTYLLDRFFDVRVIAHLTRVDKRLPNLAHNRIGFVEELAMRRVKKA